MNEVRCLRHSAISVPHGFFTRIGGVSEGPYASLNANFSGGDDPAQVAENRARVAGSLGVLPQLLLGLKQVHGTDVVMVHAPWAPGEGPVADAMVTNIPGVGLGVITADCAPVLFCDEYAGVIGVAHAGWRGAAAGILEATIGAMRELGATRIVAVVGPCIGAESYEVGPELYDAVRPTIVNADAFFRPGRKPDRLMFDLGGYCVARMRGLGIEAAHALGVDTLADNEQFFSHRRRVLSGGGAIGHQISAITL
jgi:polyphenol oxidase